MENDSVLFRGPGLTLFAMVPDIFVWELMKTGIDKHHWVDESQ